MINFPKDQLKLYPELMQKQKPLFQDIKVADVLKVSNAMISVYEFCNVMFAYFEVDYHLEPARKDLKEKEEKLAVIMKELGELNASYEKLVKTVNDLKAELKVTEDFLNELQAKMSL